MDFGRAFGPKIDSFMKSQSTLALREAYVSVNASRFLFSHLPSIASGCTMVLNLQTSKTGQRKST